MNAKFLVGKPYEIQLNLYNPKVKALNFRSVITTLIEILKFKIILS